MNKKYYVIIDTEGEYEIAICLTDKKKIIEHRSFLLSELKPSYKMGTYEQYKQNFSNSTFEEVMKYLETLNKTYNIEFFLAFHVKHEVLFFRKFAKSCKLDINWLEKKWFCLWHWANTTILNRPTFYLFIHKHKMFTKEQNPKTTLETAYSYILGKPYTQTHVGFVDTLISAELFFYIMRQRKKTPTYYSSNSWQYVHKGYKKYMKKRAEALLFYIKFII